MKTLLKRSTLLFGLMTSASAFLSLPALSMPTENHVVLELKCSGGYKVNVLRNQGSGELFYRATGPSGNLSLRGGTREDTEEAQVYNFNNGDYKYQAIRGTGDNRRQGALQVFKNGRSIMTQSCKPD